MTFIYNKKEYEIRRKELRSKMSLPEIKIWQNLRQKQAGIKFRRQFSVGRYVLDFYAPTIKLAIEIDGDSHYELSAIKKDKIRDKNLENKRIKVLRFTNLEVMSNIEGVIEKIFMEVKVRPPLYLPLSKGEKVRG